MQSEQTVKSRVYADLVRVKTIVRVFKDGSWNTKMPSGKAFIQEVETGFGTTHDVVKQFIGLCNEVTDMVSKEDVVQAKECLSGILKVPGDELYVVTLPALDSIIQVFDPIRYLQIAMETNRRHMIKHLLPVL